MTSYNFKDLYDKAGGGYDPLPVNDYDVQVAKRELGKALDRVETVNKPQAA